MQTLFEDVDIRIPSFESYSCWTFTQALEKVVQDRLAQFPGARLIQVIPFQRGLEQIRQATIIFTADEVE